MDHLLVLQEAAGEAGLAEDDEYVAGDLYKFLDDDIFNIVNVFFGASGGLLIGGVVLGIWYYFKIFEKALGYWAAVEVNKQMNSIFINFSHI